MSSPPTWSWCSTGQQPPSSNIGDGWLPFFYDAESLIASGQCASLGVFRLLHEAIAHRAAIAGVSFPVSVPPEVVAPEDAAATWSAYAATLQAVVDSGVFVTRCNQVVSEEVGILWPASVPDAVRLLASLRFVEAQVFQVVNESINVATSVRKDDVLATWPVPRFSNCRRVGGVSIAGGESLAVQMPDTVHCSTAVNVEFVYRQEAYLYLPDDGGIKPAVSGGSGPDTQEFTLEGLSEVPPEGYEDEPPPPNCEYEYFLVSGARGPVTYQDVLMQFNDKTFELDGEHLLDVTPWVQAENTVSFSEWVKLGEEATGNFSWGGSSIMEAMVYRGSGAPPATIQNRFRSFTLWGQKPWRNPGGEELATFAVVGAVEAFRSGPLAALNAGSYPFPRVDSRPRFADPGDPIKAAFLALEGANWSASVSYGLSSTGVGGGTISGEVTEFDFTIPLVQAPYYTLSVTDGTTTIKDTIVGGLGRKTCIIHSYEPSIPASVEDEEQPGIIFDGNSYVVLPLPPLEMEEPFTLFGRFRMPVTMGGVQRLLTVHADYTSLSNAFCVVVRDTSLHIEQLALNGTTVAASAVSNSFGEVEDNIFDLAIVRQLGSVQVYLNGALLATTGTGSWAAAFPVPSFLSMGGIQGLTDIGSRGRMYRSTVFNYALSTMDIERLSVHGVAEGSRWGFEGPGAVVDTDLTVGAGHHFPDRSLFLAGADGGGNIRHIIPVTYGLRSVTVGLAYDAISDDSGETWLFDLPPNCAIVRVEFEVVYDVGSATFRVGTDSQPTKFASSSISLGLQAFQSSFKRSLSNVDYTPVYLSTSEPLTEGYVRVRTIFEIRGEVA